MRLPAFYRTIRKPDKMFGKFRLLKWVGIQMHAFTINGKAVDVFLETEPGTPIIYLNTFACEGQNVFKATQVAGSPPFKRFGLEP